MSDLIGRQVRDKSNNSIKTIKDIREDTIIFSDNGRVPSSKLSENFEPVVNNTQTNLENFFKTDSYKAVDTPPLISNNQQPKVLDSLDSLGNFGSLLANMVNKNGQMQNSSYEIGDSGNSSAIPVSELTEDTKRFMREQEEMAKRGISNHIPPKDEWLENQFGNSNNVPKKEYPDGMTELEYVTKVNNGEIPINPIRSTKQPIKNNGLPTMKKTYKAKLNLEINELIPDINKIQAIQDMFDDVDILEEIAKEIAFKYLNDYQLFEDMVYAELEKIVKKSKTRTKPKPKQKPKPKTI
jgi:hypothetical protein